MTRLTRIAVLLFLASATSLPARPLFVGEPFPLTNTRYGEATGQPHLVSNGREVFLFWPTDTHIRFTRLGSDAPPSRAVLARTGGDGYGVVWTGRHFLIVSGRTFFNSRPDDDDIIGQLIDVHGEPAGGPFLIIEGGQAPRIAFDGTSVLLLHRRGGSDQIHAQLLTREGRPAAQSEPISSSGDVQSVATNGESFAAVTADLFERKLVMFDREGNVTSSKSLADAHRRFWSTLASDGERYLIVDSFGSPIHARLVNGDGSIGAFLELDTAHGWDFTPASVAWTGSKWMVAYAVSPIQLPYGVEKTFTIVQLGGDARVVEKREQRSGGAVSLAALGDQVKIAWLPQSEWGDIIQVADLPLGEQTGVAASWAATRQTVRATASADDATLVLWDERAMLHAGLRTRNGRWREQIVWPQPAFAVAAASNGEEFAIVITAPEGWFVLRLDSEGRPIGEATQVTGMYPTQIRWTGREFLLVGAWDDLVVATLTDEGISPPRIVAIPEAESVTFAASPGGFFATWLITGPFQTPGGSPRLGVAGIRLNADFEPLDPSPTTFVLENRDAIYSAAVGWDGTQYVVVWSGDQGIRAAHIPAGGGAHTLRNIAADGLAGDTRVTTVHGGVAIDWNRYSDDGTAVPTPRFAMLLAEGTTTEPMTLRRGTATEIASLPGGEVALVESVLHNDAPVEGTHRVTMSILSQAPLPQRPQSPAATAIMRGQTAELRWAAPPQAVQGYRVESRIEEGPWTEIESVLAADTLSVSIPTQGKPTVLRVRAWNDAGTGEYSQPVVVNGGRRRSVR